MGNCLKSSNADNISLLRGSDSIVRHDFNSLEQHSNSSLSNQSQFRQSTLFYPTSSSGALTISEDEKIKMAKRTALIQHLPMGTYSDSKISPECVICMVEFHQGEPVRFLPCLHIYHAQCIDDWLMRSFTCPSCMEPVDAALLNIYET